MKEDDPEQLVLQAASTLGLSRDEAFGIIRNSFDMPSPQDSLLDTFGLEAVGLVFSILQHKEYFLVEDRRNDELHYVEHHIAPGRSIPVDPASLVPTKATGDNAKFFKYSTFNPVQSQVFSAAYEADSNMLVCAPTGAGKTDVALLAVLRALKTPSGKAVLVVPMKALAAEITAKYTRVFAGTAIEVVEYTGDTEIPASVANRARVVVCTPEKFDVATRRLSPIFSGLNLLVIDEVHLLGDDRGPVLEVLVARMFRMSEQHQRVIRIVALSATLPNYRDVAKFIRAESVFFFDAMYRPVPLAITVTGFKKGSKRTDEEAYLVEQVRKHRTKGHQMLVFVHSRNMTVSVAKLLAENFAEHVYKRESSPRTRKKTGFDGTADWLVQQRFGIHHAGMSRNARLAMEGLFRSGGIDVLVCTSTLAWGVNLPAHAVIIYGTSFYSPAKGDFDDLGILDVVQIFGRAGRPQYDTEGEAVLITRAAKMDGYIAMLKASSDIESRMLYHVTDAICAETYLSTIYSMATALSWIKNTFLYVRMLKNPAMYGLASSEQLPMRFSSMSISSVQGAFSVDENAIADYLLLAVKRLEASGLVKINRVVENDHNTWRFETTVFGRIASSYYLRHQTVHGWLTKLSAGETQIILLLLGASEFGSIVLRGDETAYLEQLHAQMLLSRDIDIDYEASVECKLIILVAAHVNYIKPATFSLCCDMDYIVDVLERLIGAMREVLLYLKKYELYQELLAFERRVARKKSVPMVIVEAEVHRCGEFLDVKLEPAQCGAVRSSKIGGAADRHGCEGRNGPNKAGGSTDMSRECHGYSHAASRHGSSRKDKPSKYALLVFSGKKIAYAGEFQHGFRNFVRAGGSNLRFEIHGLDCQQTIVPSASVKYSMAGLRQYGIHACDLDYRLGMRMYHGCAHIQEIRPDLPIGPVCKSICKWPEKVTYNNDLSSIRWNISVQYVIMDVPLLKEREKAIDNKLYRLRGDSILVICSGNVQECVNTLNTKLLLDNSSARLYDCRNPGLENAPGCLWVASMPEARRIYKKYSLVVFRGCFDNKRFYSLYDIMEICDGRSAIVYENAEFVEYMKAIVRMC